MKKLFLLMLATVMLLTAAPTALSEAETAELPPDLFDVLLYDGASPTWIANALQFSNGILLAPAAVKDYPVSQLAVSDGVNFDSKSMNDLAKTINDIVTQINADLEKEFAKKFKEIQG